MRFMERKSGSLLYISCWNNSFFVLFNSSVPGEGGTLIIPPSSAMGEAGTVPVGAAGAALLSGAASPSWQFPASQISLPAFMGSCNGPKASARVSRGYFCVGRREKTNSGCICKSIFGHPQSKESAGVLDIPSQREVIKQLLIPIAAGMFCRILENTGNHKLRLIQPH